LLGGPRAAMRGPHCEFFGGANRMVNRRHFFRLFLRDLMVVGEELCGQGHFKLSDLGQLPASELGRICPRIADGRDVWVADETLWAAEGEASEPQRVGAAGPLEAWLLDRLTGTSSLDEIAASLAAAWKLEEEEGFRQARDFFLRLALNGLCVPANTCLWSDDPPPAPLPPAIGGTRT